MLKYNQVLSMATTKTGLTFVLDLTFDLTFCLLFSFFLLKAFFPLKLNNDISVLITIWVVPTCAKSGQVEELISFFLFLK